MENKKIYAVDFDGTLNLGKWPQVGEPNLKLFAFLKKARAAGHKVILWTCREGDQLKTAIKYCQKQGLDFDAINDNLHENKLKYENNSRKIYADHYIDDRSVLPEKIVETVSFHDRKDIPKLMRPAEFRCANCNAWLNFSVVPGVGPQRVCKCGQKITWYWALEDK